MKKSDRSLRLINYKTHKKAQEWINMYSMTVII